MEIPSYELIYHGNDEDPWYAVMILDGPYEGLVYKYDWISIPLNIDEKKELPFKFQYSIMDTNGLTIDSIVEEMMFNILATVVLDEFDRRDNESNRGDDT
tara:strand:+ start:9947 stop:10246 length:300 start_codon:yes stop_codon:yes gene_type:complete